MKNRTASLYNNSIAVVMDADRNPLSKMPPIQRFQIMTVLSIMWTTIFCTSIGAWFLYGELVVGHVLALLGIFVTAGVFRSTDRHPKTYRDFPRKDGTARYDDVWGA